MQKPIPSVLMRGGTSRGLFFRREDLPEDRTAISEILIAAMGSQDPSQIDGIGGTSSLTSKVAIVCRSTEAGAHIDYLFAQVAADRPVVDFGPTCGNMLAGVGPFALETGMIKATDGETTVRIRSVNTGATIEAIIQTPNETVSYDGDTAIDGVPGTAAPVVLNFENAAGSDASSLFPTGNQTDIIDGIAVSLVNGPMPAMIVRAGDVGKTGYEQPAALDEDRLFFGRLEDLRREAGRHMGLGDVSDSVVPKIMLVAEPRRGGTITSRYLVPDRTHRAHAVTGAITLAHCVATPGTVTDDLSTKPVALPATINIEHPSGTLAILLNKETAGVIRTARRLFAGEIYVPEQLTPCEKAA
jgi:2-methylaconitate cis-trans-isomerase PrpF